MIPSALVHVALYPLNATPRFLACVTGQCLLFEPLLGRGGKQREGGRGLPRSLKSAVDSLPLPFYHPYEAMLSFTSHADLHVASMCLLLWASFWSLLYPSGGGGVNSRNLCKSGYVRNPCNAGSVRNSCKSGYVRNPTHVAAIPRTIFYAPCCLKSQHWQAVSMSRDPCTRLAFALVGTAG